MADLAPRPIPSPELTVGLYGLGRIGTVLLTALRRFAPDFTVVATGRDLARAALAARSHAGVEVVTEAELASRAELVVLCLPPGAYRSTMQRLESHLRSDAVLVSVTNGVSLSDLATWSSHPIVKIIPSPAHAVGCGVCLVTAGPRAQDQHVAKVTDLLSAFCRPVLTDPLDSRIASNLAGCAPAIIAGFCQAFLDANAARSQVLNRAALTAMMEESVAALAALLADGVAFQDVIASTATPGGTTEAAIAVLRQDGAELAERLVDATFAREAELLASSPHPIASRHPAALR